MSVQHSFCLKGHCNCFIGPVHPGHHRQKEYWCPQRHGTSVHRLDHLGHWSVHGSELWISHKPSTRPRPAALYSGCWVGHGCVQVIQKSTFSQYAFENVIIINTKSQESRMKRGDAIFTVLPCLLHEPIQRGALPSQILFLSQSA